MCLLHHFPILISNAKIHKMMMHDFIKCCYSFKHKQLPILCHSVFYVFLSLYTKRFIGECVTTIFTLGCCYHFYFLSFSFSFSSFLSCQYRFDRMAAEIVVDSNTKFFIRADNTGSNNRQILFNHSKPTYKPNTNKLQIANVELLLNFHNDISFITHGLFSSKLSHWFLFFWNVDTFDDIKQ